MYKTKKIGLELIGLSFIAIMVIFTVYPIIYTILGSFKTNSELTLGGSFFPSIWHFKNYYQAFVQADFTKYTLNSVVVSLTTMVVGTATSALAGFVFARKTFVFKKLILGMYISLMFVALGSVTLYPIYSMLVVLKLNKTILGLILALTGGQASHVLLVMGFIRAIPKELDEAATIDGCNVYGIFFRIILPLIKPILAVVALFVFRSAWNDYITTLVMSISMPKLKTLTVAVVQLKYSINAAAEWHIMLAGASIAIIPILMVYFFCNKQFIGGLTAGAIKG
ncbi:carbohydrate ABC transporter permease [Cellulosilyticum sp. I15G10I2]|uniref:carbohydrate ABC transporter permease n=1 Tax=Cellulosilyticum sp. I15G10I2 TaxID=1892843 RepID=UPI00085BF09E|nr:carbohydrate ABC transporter permease [Cellulosilyticum sp. I15G10I2]